LNNVKDGKYIFEEFTSRFENQDVHGGKGSLTDPGIRVPMIANWPGRVEPGVCNALIDASDILPTLASVANAEIPAGAHVDGQSMSGLWGGQPGARDWVFAEYNGRACVRNERWKLYSDGRFYEIGSDPDERSTLSTSSLSADAALAYQRLKSGLDSLGYNDQHHPN
jgi:arylsulfatase A